MALCNVTGRLKLLLNCRYVFFLNLQQFSATFITHGADYTMKYEWITDEGRLRMLGLLNETNVSMNSTQI